MAREQGHVFHFDRNAAGLLRLSVRADPDQAAGFSVSVNGYGAPRDPLTDGNLRRYLSQVFDWLDLHDRRVREVFLCGGYTNRHDLSEAEAMRGWVAVHRPTWLPRVRLIDTTASVRENIEAFNMAMAPGLHPVLFCERSRIWTVFWLAQCLFPADRPVTAAGVRFDERSLRFAHRFAQFFFHAPIERLSLLWPWLDRWRVRRRLRRIGQARAAYDAERQLKGGGS